MGHPTFGDEGLPEALDARVRSELREGERLLWVGQPRPGSFARRTIPAVVVGVPWTAFSLFWTALASRLLFGDFGKAPGESLAFRVILPLFGVSFVLIGVWMSTAPLRERQKARRTCYVLTDRRVILWNAGSRGSVEIRAYGPGDLKKIHRVEYPNGDGDLVIEEIVTIERDSEGDRTVKTRRHGFMGIKDVREVENLLRKTLHLDDDKPYAPEGDFG